MSKSPFVTCLHCSSEQPDGYKFCSNCGKRNELSILREFKRKDDIDSNIRYLSWYSIITVVFLLVSALGDYSFEFLVTATIFFAIIDVIFTFLQSGTWGLLNMKQLRIIPAISIVFICIVSGIIVSYLADFLNLSLFHEKSGYMHLFSGLDNALLYALILIAVFPAFFEELAFRGFVYNNLVKISGNKSAILGSTFLFAIVHFSLLSLFWIVPFGLILANFRRKYSKLWYGILGHFTHNTTILLIEYYGIFQ